MHIDVCGVFVFKKKPNLKHQKSIINSLFYLFSTLALVSGEMVIQARNPVHSVLYLILVFFNAAGLIILLGLDYFAMIFLVAYVGVGAMTVLFLFVVMMLNINLAEFNEKRLRYLFMATLLCLLFLTILSPWTGIIRLWEKKYFILLTDFSYMASLSLIITFLFFWINSIEILLHNGWIIANYLVPIQELLADLVEISYRDMSGMPGPALFFPLEDFPELEFEQDAAEQDAAEQGEQPNTWDLFQPQDQDAMSRAKRPRR